MKKKLFNFICEFSEIRRSENQLYESSCPMGPVNSLCRNLQLEDANQGKNFFAHFAENAEFAVEHFSSWI